MIRIKDAVTTIVFDFDGVIKDSLEVKSSAFNQLFSIFGDDIARRVKEHHELNGGVSRSDKLPIYLEWAGQPNSKKQVKEYENKLVYLMSVEKAKFRNPVLPDCELHLEIEAIRSHGRVWKYKGTAKVDGKRMADAEWSATIVDRN